MWIAERLAARLAAHRPVGLRPRGVLVRLGPDCACKGCGVVMPLLAGPGRQ